MYDVLLCFSFVSGTKPPLVCSRNVLIALLVLFMRGCWFLDECLVVVLIPSLSLVVSSRFLDNAFTITYLNIHFVFLAQDVLLYECVTIVFHLVDLVNVLDV